MTGAPSPPLPGKQTPLHAAHRQLGARMVDFGGWLMPLHYPPGIVEEHEATRRALGIFDVSHMGEIHFRGAGAAAAVQRLCTNHIGRLPDGAALYTVACRPDGGIVDDLIVYRLSDQHFLAVVNASNIDKDLAWFEENAGQSCEIRDASEETALIAYQGPSAEAALAPLVGGATLPPRPFLLLPSAHIAGRPASIARTGYTGEDGFEIFCASEHAVPLWEALLEAGARHGGLPVGLGARDTLRLEARLSLYGNELGETTTPLEAGLGWVVKWEAGDFLGKESLLRQRAAGPARKLVGFVIEGRGIARHGYGIHASADGPKTGDKSGNRIGTVTSGGFGPTVGKSIGLGYVPAELAEPGQRLAIDCRGRMAQAEVVKGPFYRRKEAPSA
jgi:aminomethyltransferase